MFSEESNAEDVGGNRHSVLTIKPLPLRAPKVDRFFKRPDHFAIVIVQYGEFGLFYD